MVSAEDVERRLLEHAMVSAEDVERRLLEHGVTPERAREVAPRLLRECGEKALVSEVAQMDYFAVLLTQVIQREANRGKETPERHRKRRGRKTDHFNSLAATVAVDLRLPSSENIKAVAAAIEAVKKRYRQAPGSWNVDTVKRTMQRIAEGKQRRINYPVDLLDAAIAEMGGHPLQDIAAQRNELLRTYRKLKRQEWALRVKHKFYR